MIFDQMFSLIQVLDVIGILQCAFVVVIVVLRAADGVGEHDEADGDHHPSRHDPRRASGCEAPQSLQQRAHGRHPLMSRGRIKAHF